MKLSLKELQHLYDLRILILKHGYWSEEVKEFNSKLNYKTMVKINSIKDEAEI